jgi:hypothetical protein
MHGPLTDSGPGSAIERPSQMFRRECPHLLWDDTAEKSGYFVTSLAAAMPARRPMLVAVMRPEPER